MGEQNIKKGNWMNPEEYVYIYNHIARVVDGFIITNVCLNVVCLSLFPLSLFI